MAKDEKKVIWQQKENQLAAFSDSPQRMLELSEVTFSLGSGPAHLTKFIVATHSRMAPSCSFPNFNP